MLRDRRFWLSLAAGLVLVGMHAYLLLDGPLPDTLNTRFGIITFMLAALAIPVIFGRDYAAVMGVTFVSFAALSLSLPLWLWLWGLGDIDRGFIDGVAHLINEAQSLSTDRGAAFATGWTILTYFLALALLRQDELHIKGGGEMIVT